MARPAPRWTALHRRWWMIGGRLILLLAIAAPSIGPAAPFLKRALDTPALGAASALLLGMAIARGLQCWARRTGP